jgi:TatD DNase family protein
MTGKANRFTYYLGDTMYINLTNLCTNKCKFCIRSAGDTVGGVNLILDNEKFTAADVITELERTFEDRCREIVFCGYGEPLIKLDIVKSVAAFIKDNYPNVPVRINTNGHANLIHKKNIVPELGGIIDKISISLNAQDAELYNRLCSPSLEKDKAYEAVKEFIRLCAQNGIETTASVVSGFEDFDVDVEECGRIAASLGAKLRVREWLPQGYDS